MTTAYSGDGITFPDNSVQATAPRVGMVNRIINGDMRIDQRNAGAAVTLTATTASYITDRWYCNNTSDAVLSVTRDTSAPSGFTNSTKVTVSTADASIGATQNSYFAQWIEGYNSADLAWGTASASTVTLSFWVRSSLTGTFGGVLTNSAIDRSYPFTYSISSANTWEQKSITVAGDTSGTWLKDNGVGVRVWFALGTGSTYTGTAGVWAGTEYRGATGQTDIIATSGATWQITGVQLEKGSTATDFEYVDYGRQLQMCQRYYQQIKGAGRHFIAGNGSVSQCFPTMYLRVTMRGTCSFSFSSLSHFTIEGLTGGGQSIATGLSLNASTLDTVTIQASSGGSTSATAAQVFGNTAAAVSGFSAEL
tara:strand:- start:212 stop:1306 length:1095 start_codon:yes stop_codon:yes gene_type:complete